MNRSRDAAIVIAVAAIAHFTYFALRFGSFYFPDSFTYLEPAKQMLAGHGFISGGQIETLRTPGYPLLLALFGARTVPVIVLQHLISIALAVAIFFFTLPRGRFAAYAASLIFALDVPSIHIANKLLTETVFTALLFLILVMKPRPIVMGLLTGVLVLIRPIAILFFVIAALRIPRRELVAFLAAALVLPVGWATRNWVHTHVFTVSSIGDINLLGQRAAGALAIEDGGDFRADLLDEENGLTEDADDFIQKAMHIPDAQELPVAVRAKWYGRYARQVIAEHPVAFAELTIRGVLVNLFDSAWEAMEPVSRLHPSTLELLLGAIPVIVFVFAVIGAVVLKDRVLLLTVVYFIFMSAGGEAEARFRIPVMPQMAIAAAVGLDAIRRAVASR